MRDRPLLRSFARTVAVLGLLAAACLASASAAQAAEDRHLRLDYAVYVGGFRTFNISHDARLEPAAYAMTLSLQGRGILDWWFSWTMKAFSEGRLAGGAVVPVRAGADSAWRGKHRRTRITYPADGLPMVKITPAPDEADGERGIVMPAQRRGARDLAGAVLALLTRIGTKNRCDAREPVFDGRRRYDLVLAHVGQDRLESSTYSPFGGAALKCSLKIDRIAGYRRHGSRSRWGIDDTATVWLGAPFGGIPPVPVRLELETPLGMLKAHLVSAAIRSDGTSRTLAAAP